MLTGLTRLARTLAFAAATTIASLPSALAQATPPAAPPRATRPPDPERIGPSLPIRHHGRIIRDLGLSLEKSPDASRVPTHFRYFIDPPFDPVPPETRIAGFPRWVSEVRYIGNDQVRFSMRLRLISDDLRDAGRTVVSVVEAEQLAARANSKRPTISVEKLPISSLRVDLLDRTDRSILASASAETVGGGEDVELWFVVNRSSLTSVLDVDRRGDVALRPSYSYFNRPMAEAILVTTGDLKLHDELITFLQSRQWTENVEVAQWTRDEFIRAVEVKIRTRLAATHPQAAALVVNNSTLIVGALLQRVNSVPFEQFASTSAFDREALARHLQPHGFERIAARSDDKVDEFRHIDRTSTSVEGSVGVAIPIGASKIGIDVGAGSTNEIIDATYKKTGVLLQYSDTTQGFRPSKIDVYRAVKSENAVAMSATAEVSVGLDTVDGVFGGTPFNLAELTPEVIRESLQQIEAFYKTHGESLRRMEAPVQLAKAQLNHVNGWIDESEKGIDELGGLSLKVRSVIDTQGVKTAERARTAGLINAYIHVIDHIFHKHFEMDKEEATETKGQMYANHRTPKLAELNGQLTRLDAELATAEASTRDAERIVEAKRSDLTRRTEELQSTLNRARTADASASLDRLAPSRSSSQFRTIQQNAREIAEQRAKTYDALEAVLNERQGALDRALTQEKAARSIYGDFPDRLMALADYEGNVQGCDTLDAAYVEHVRKNHDEGEATDLRQWREGEVAGYKRDHLEPARAAVDAIAGRKAEAAHADTDFQAEVAKVKTADSKVKALVEDLTRIESELADAIRALVRLSAE